ncbi:actin-related protein 6 [Zootermopsis nevadensis]|uniref:Actin-related protein 6 n=1 Tax=Zootermopsis nevadensis TaxID=136037 RepID=A0A067QRY8_ZOONE|nr:actin-related protein 6 [Zootermopsis nevadensis]XP_021933105.1 actin-related protein 6 [Zootermopsis nevadensis]KDR12327.1 Actin-related protein 6 [Zootermopsis nevadensis]
MCYEYFGSYAEGLYKMATNKAVFILDNGAYTAKVGFSHSDHPRVIPNCIMKAKSERRRPFVGDQLEDCRDVSGLFYILPFQKGYLVNWDVQKNVWDYIFSKECCPVNFTEAPLIVTEPYFNFPSVQEAMTEIFFEEYECTSLLRINAGDLSCYNYMKKNAGTLCCLLVDSGYSFTHIAPYIKGKKLKQGIIRIDVGGKMLTNHLKEIISYRQLHVMDETHVMNQVKEDACFVSQNFLHDMEIARKRDAENTIARDYVLPDFTTLRRGYVRSIGTADKSSESEQQQILRLNNERFTVPEILFQPSDLGISQMGIPEAICHSISVCPAEAQSHLFANILLTGGCTLFPGFRERVEAEVRSRAPDHVDVRVTLPANPVTYAWQGGASLQQDPEFFNMTVSREEYEEEGHNLCFEKFDI